MWPYGPGLEGLQGLGFRVHFMALPGSWSDILMALVFGVRCFNFRVQDLGFPLWSKEFCFVFSGLAILNFNFNQGPNLTGCE